MGKLQLCLQDLKSLSSEKKSASVNYELSLSQVCAGGRGGGLVMWKTYKLYTREITNKAAFLQSKLINLKWKFR